MIRRWRRGMVALLAVTTLALVGLLPTAAGATVDRASSAPSGDPIVIGTICSCSGVLAPSIGKSLDVMKIWVKWINAHGGLNGHPVVLKAYDDGQDSARGLAAAKKLVEQDHVVAIVGQMSLVGADWASYVDDAGVPVVGGITVDIPYITDPNFYPSGSTLPMLLQAVVTLAKDSGKKKLGVYYCSETPVCSALPTILTPLVKDAGMEIESAKVSQAQPDYTAACLQFKQAGVDAVFGGVNSDVVPRIADSCAQQGYKPLSVASSGTTQRSWLSNPNLQGALIGGTNAVYTDSSVPGVKTFLDAIKKYQPNLLESPQFSYPLIFPWAGAQLFAEVADLAKLTPESTSADVVAGLAMVKDETLDGVSPPLTFVTGKTTFPLCYFTSKVTKKEFKLLNNGESTCLTAEEGAALLNQIGLG